MIYTNTLYTVATEEVANEFIAYVNSRTDLIGADLINIDEEDGIFAEEIAIHTCEAIDREYLVQLVKDFNSTEIEYLDEYIENKESFKL